MTEHLLLLAALLAPAHHDVAERVTLASNQPAVYLETHEDTAERLGWNPDASQLKPLPWLALVDGLIEARVATELDWKGAREEVIPMLGLLAGHELLSGATRQRLDPSRRDENGSTIHWLREAATAVSSDDVIVAALDIESDSYVVVLIKATVYRKAQDHARAAGHVLRDIRELDPNDFSD